MSTSHIDRMEAESKARIHALATNPGKWERVTAKDVFANPAVSKTISHDKTVISGFQTRRILAAVPLNTAVYVEICPGCECVGDYSLIKPFLERGAVIPILLASYNRYPESFVEKVVSFPHISPHEFYFFRYLSLLSTHKSGLCNHCVDVSKEKTLAAIPGSADSKALTQRIDKVYRLLHPYVTPDFQLFDSFREAIARNDLHNLVQAENLCHAVRSLRTAEAFRARPDLPYASLAALSTQLSFGGENTVSMTELRESMARGLELTIPETDTGRYLDIAMTERAGITKALNGLLKQSTDSSGTVSLASVQNRISVLNDQIRVKTNSTRFLLYRAAVDVGGSNKTLILSALAAGTLGLTGNLFGCGAAVATAAGARLLKSKMPKVHPAPSLLALGEKIHHDIEPAIGALLAAYLSMGLQAVRIWQIRENIKGKCSASARTIDVDAKPAVVKPRARLTSATTRRKTKVRGSTQSPRRSSIPQSV